MCGVSRDAFEGISLSTESWDELGRHAGVWSGVCGDGMWLDWVRYGGGTVGVRWVGWGSGEILWGEVGVG